MARDLILMEMAEKYTAGQCCVSMVSYVALQTALDALELKGGTNFQNMIGALNKLKTKCDQAPRPAGRPPLPVARAIVEIKSKVNTKYSHWAVWSAGAWYCPHKGFSESTYHHLWPRHFFPARFIEVRS